MAIFATTTTMDQMNSLQKFMVDRRHRRSLEQLNDFCKEHDCCIYQSNDPELKNCISIFTSKGQIICVLYKTQNNKYRLS